MKLPRGAVAGTLALTAVLVMGGSALNGFVYDDVPVVVENPHVTDPAAWHLIPTSTYWLGTLWRPVTVFGYALQWAAGKGHAWLFHEVSLIAYIAIAMLLFTLLRRLGLGSTGALGAAMLFLVHPVHVEVVANVVGQAELWTTLALLGSTLLYLRARQHDAPFGAVLALLVTVTIGIMAKEQGFVAPLLLLGAEWLLPGERIDRASIRFRILAVVTALALILLSVRHNITGSLGGETASSALAGLGLRGRALVFLSVVPEYARLLVWPWHLQAEYGPPGIPVTGISSARILLGAVLVACIIALFFLLRRRKPVAAFGLWWAAVTLGPVSNLLAATGIVMAERVFFLPSLGFVVAAAVGLDAMASQPRRSVLVNVGAAALACWCVAAGVRSAMRVPVWRTEARFFTQLPLDAPRSYRAWMVAGEYWQRKSRLPDAERDLRGALALWRRDPKIHEMLGQVLRREGRCAEAIPVFAAGLPLDPERASLRAKEVECLIVERRWSDAEQLAEGGLALGQGGFSLSLDRIRRAEAAAKPQP